MAYHQPISVTAPASASTMASPSTPSKHKKKFHKSRSGSGDNKHTTKVIPNKRRALFLSLLYCAVIVMMIHQFRQTGNVMNSTKKSVEPESMFFRPSDPARGLLGFDKLFDDKDLDDDSTNFVGDDDNHYDDDDSVSVDRAEVSDILSKQQRNAQQELDLQRIRDAIDKQARENEGRVDKQFVQLYRKALVQKNRKRNRDMMMMGMNSTSGDYNNNNTNTPYKELMEQKKAKRREIVEMRRDRKDRRRVTSRAERSWRPPNFNTTDYTKFPPLQSTVLPDMTTNGGVVFFLHVPKTGGQTIRQLNSRFRKHLQRKTRHDDRRYREDLKLLTKKQLRAQQRREILADTKQHKSTPEEEELIKLSSRIKFVVANRLKVFHDQAVPQVNKYLNSSSEKDNKILFVEVHGMDNYQAFELEPYLHHWRQQAKARGVPFFAFTILREALSLQVSFFNYYYIHPGDFRFCNNPLKPRLKCGETNLDKVKYRRERVKLHRAPKGEGREGRLKFLMDMKDKARRGRGGEGEHANGMQGVSHQELERVLTKVAYENPQCIFLARGERAYGDDPDEQRQREGLRRPECQQAYMSLQRTMDWIGRTDTMSSETLPLLTNILFRKPQLGQHMPKANVSPHKGGWVKLEQVQSSTRKALEKASQLDQELYHRVKQDYTMDQWENVAQRL